MKAVNIRELKNNPSAALRLAEKDTVVVLNRDRPAALLVSLADVDVLKDWDVTTALAVALYKAECLSLAKAARIAGMALEEFMVEVSRRGIPVIRGDARSLDRDLNTLDAWLKEPSSSTPGH